MEKLVLGKWNHNCRGFSTVELGTTVAIILITAAITVPNAVKATNTYSVNNTAFSVSSLIQRARYEAIKQNTKISCYFQTSPLAVWVDVNGTGSFSANDPKFVYPSQVQAGGSSAPSYGSMNFSSTTDPTTLGRITFDSRGAVDYSGTTPPNTPTVWVLSFSLNGDSSYGYKAVSVEPLGRTKIWTAPAGSTSWQSQ